MKRINCFIFAMLSFSLAFATSNEIESLNHRLYQKLDAEILSLKDRIVSCLSPTGCQDEDRDPVISDKLSAALLNIFLERYEAVARLKLELASPENPAGTITVAGFFKPKRITYFVSQNEIERSFPHLIIAASFADSVALSKNGTYHKKQICSDPEFARRNGVATEYFCNPESGSPAVDWVRFHPFGFLL